MGIEDIFLTLLNDLPFKDTLVGETYPLRRKSGNTVKIFPVAINTPSTCDNSVYRSLVPDSTKTSIIYFEKSEPTVRQVDRHYFHLTENWRLVCWLYMKQINKNHKLIYPFMETVLLRIPEEYGNYGNWMDIYFLFKGQVPKEQIFNQYTYDEAEKQFMIYPYGAFALDYEVRYRIGKECLTDVTLDPDLC